ncbi:hypothetical protein MATL_G00227310 [Megalops atlanticus]|uniref:Biotinidase n=1 Tax=Megalops atlanticus TaxID=7932 RepID=A0A9D3PEE5_MEGAT|nr:hypothetical protein MATL_G00227310 [Megalops atlanticus]
MISPMAVCALRAVAVLWLCAGGAEARSYVAAVYEHRVVLNARPAERLSRSAALRHMQQNLDVFEEQVTAAAKQGAQIIVFPEDAIHGFNFSRESVAGYLQTVPDPAAVRWSPCSDPSRFPNTEVLHRLSCMARDSALFVVANLPDRQPCDAGSDRRCPPDGRYQFNTDVVFSDNGTIVARYHKHNLYFEAAFDAPAEPELVTFHTPFAGRFGVFTCFDILFAEPALALVEARGVRQLVYPTAWMNQLPLLAAVQFQRSFSYAAGVTLLAANVRSAALGMTGSGIFTPWQALYHHDTRGETGKLLVATVPVLDPDAAGGTGGGPLPLPFSGYPEPEFCLREGGECEGGGGAFPEAPAVPSSTFAAEMMYDNFTMALLEGSAGNVTVCDGALCCHLLFRRSGAADEPYALAAFQGLHVVHGTYALEVCALVRCAGPAPSGCGGEVDHAHTLMDFWLAGTFSTRHVFPGVLGSGVQPDRPDRSGWEGRHFSMSRAGMRAGLLTAVLYGRAYDRDHG